MQIPTEIKFHEIPSRDSVEAAIQRWVTRLELMNGGIVRCRVVIDRPHKLYAREFAIQIVISLPGPDVVAGARHEDVYVAIADAFRDARRQLMDQAEAGRGIITAPALRDRP